MKLKVCGKCKKTKSVSEFHKDKYTKTGYTCLCKECFRIERKLYRDKHSEKIKQYSKKYKKNNYNKVKKWELMHKYGLSLEQYLNKLNSQGNKCSICLETLNDKIGERGICVDHDHINNRVRDLLCPRCNILLGQCGESVTLLQLAINYIIKWRDK